MDIKGFEKWLLQRYNQRTARKFITNLKMLNNKGIDPDTTTEEYIRRIFWRETTKTRNYKTAVIRRYREFLNDNNKK